MFSEATCINWIVERGNANPKRFLYKKVYLSTVKKKNKNKSASEFSIRKIFNRKRKILTQSK